MKQFYFILFLVFSLISILIFSYTSFVKVQDFDVKAIAIGNLILAIVIGISFTMIKKSLSSDNANNLVRAKMKGTLIKFFTLIPIFLVYIYLNKEQIHKPTLYILLALYVLYLVLEVIYLSTIAKKK